MLYYNRQYCPICGKLTPFRSWHLGYTITCGNDCKKINDAKNLKEKATPKVQSLEIKNKRKRTCLNKYGADNPFKVQKIKDKIAKTNLKKYGVKHPAQNEEVKEKIKNTNLSNHGEKWNLQLSNTRDKGKEKTREKIETFERNNICTQKEKLIHQYGPGWLNLNLPQITSERYIYIENKFIPLIQKHYEETLNKINHVEQEIYDFCRSILPKNIDIIKNDRNTIIGKKGRNLELDIYIPEKKVAIEYNGIVWHSKEEKNYHLYKTEECEKPGIRLLHIWEDLWYSKKEIYKSIISSSLGLYERKIYARKCECREISSKESEEFLNRNHLQGAIRSSLRLGLFYGGELVQVTTWGKSRFKKGEYELYRMCSLLNTQVVGGFSKLITHSGLDTFISYVDRSLYNGKGYFNSGFKLLEYTSSGYFYCNGKLQRVNRVSAQKYKLASFIKDFNPFLTEVENMENSGYFRIFDSGNIKVLYNKSS